MVLSKDDLRLHSCWQGIQAKLEHEGEYLDRVKDFKFWGSYKSADGDCTNEIKMARQKAVELTTIWKDKNVTSALKIRVMKSMVWAVFQYGVEGWTLKKSDRNRIESFEMWCWRKMLGISWKEHCTIYQYWGNGIRWNETKHVEMEQFLHAFALRGFVSVSWAFLLSIMI